MSQTKSITKIVKNIYMKFSSKIGSFFLQGNVWVSHLVVSNSLRPDELQPVRLLYPWDSPGKNTGVDCQSFLQMVFLTQGSNPGLLHCRQILYHLSYSEDLGQGESESEVSQLCPTLCDPMDCSLPVSSVHEFSRQKCWRGLSCPSEHIFPTQGSNLGLLCLLQVNSLPLGKPPSTSRIFK